MKRPSIGLLLSWLGLALILLGVLVVVTFCRPKPEPPTIVTPTVTATFPAPPTTLTRTPTAAPPTATVGPTAYPPDFTPRPTWRPPLPTRTPRPTSVPVPTSTPVAMKGRVRVEPGDTLWGIACRAYDDIPLRPGANPLTPCTCWPGLWVANIHIDDARLILPRWWVDVPKACIQAPLR